MKSLREGFWEEKWQQIADHMLGRREIIDKDSPGRRREINLYDTTGRTMVNLLAGGLHSLLTNPATDWFDLRLEDEALMEIHEVNVWLEAVKKRLLAVFRSPVSRFTSQIDEVYLDLVAFGTGGLFIGDEPGDPVLFSSVPIGRLYIAENERGEIDTVFNRFPMTSRNAVRMWGSDAPARAKKNVDDGRDEERICIIHGVYPSDDPSKRMPLLNVPLRFTSVYLCEEDGSMLGRPNGYPEKPYIVSRWRVDGGEVYGRGPGDDALAEQKMVGAMKQTSLQAGQMGVAPPFLTEDDGSIVQLDMRPFGRNIVKPGGMLDPPIQMLESKTRADIGIDLIRDSRQQVEEAFHFELLKLIQNRGLTPMTARQATMIQGAVERLLAPILGRQHEDLLGPTLDRVFGIESRRGNLPAAPEIIQDMPLRVEYLSPITRAQRRGDVEAVAEWLNAVVGYGQVRPEALDLPDWDTALRFLGTEGEVPASLMHSQREMAMLREAQRRAAAEQQQQEEIAGAAKAMGQAAPALALLQGGRGQ